MVRTPLHENRDSTPEEFGLVRRWQLASTAALALLAAVAAGLGLLVDGFYDDPAVLLPQLYGQDAVTLLVGVPLLVAGLLGAMRGSARGYVVWLGALGYMLYTWASYVAILSFGSFFLGYVALFSLSLFTFVGAVVDCPAGPIASSLEGKLPVSAVVGYVGLAAGLVGIAWLAEVVPATLSDEVPETIVESGLQTNVIYVLDLGVLVPAAAIVGWWLWQGRAWGYVFGGVLLVKLATLGLAVLAMAVQMQLDGQSVPVPLAAIFGLVTLGAVVLGGLYLKAMGSSSAPSGGGSGSKWEPLGRR